MQFIAEALPFIPEVVSEVAATVRESAAALTAIGLGAFTTAGVVSWSHSSELDQELDQTAMSFQFGDFLTTVPVKPGVTATPPKPIKWDWTTKTNPNFAFDASAGHKRPRNASGPPNLFRVNRPTNFTRWGSNGSQRAARRRRRKRYA